MGRLYNFFTSLLTNPQTFTTAEFDEPLFTRHTPGLNELRENNKLQYSLSCQFNKVYLILETKYITVVRNFP